MKTLNPRSRYLVVCLLVLMSAATAFPQKRAKKKHHAKHVSQAVLWEKIDTSSLDLYDGPGGEKYRPDLSKITFVEEDKSGHNKKYRITDGKGREWVAKLGSEARPETVAVRFLWALGYKTEINYLVPKITIPSKGTFENVRLELRRDNVDRGDIWKWKDNPFVGSDQLQGLKIMMVFMTNWDLLDMQNKILNVTGKNGRIEQQYIISDLGATFGKLGNNNFPIFFRLGRKTGDAEAWSKTDFVDEIEKDGTLDFAFKGKGRHLMNDITIAQGRWLSEKLNRLKEHQVRDAFRAGNFSPSEIDLYTRTAMRKIRELSDAVSGRQMIAKR